MQHCRKTNRGRTEVSTGFGNLQELECSPNRKTASPIHVGHWWAPSHSLAWTGLDWELGPTKGDNRMNVEMHRLGSFSYCWGWDSAGG